MAHMKDLTGQRFGSRVVLRTAGRYGRMIQWLTRCDCGRECIVVGSRLTQGKANQCITCRETTHGHRIGAVSTPEYSTWLNMVQRCTNPNTKDYKNYGGRGITICKRWRKFENFLKDMGPKPKGLTIERKNNNRGYSPSNCVWATRTQQIHNRRNMK